MTVNRISDMICGAWFGTVLFCTVRVIWAGDYWWGVFGFLLLVYWVLKQMRTWRSQFTEIERLKESLMRARRAARFSLKCDQCGGVVHMLAEGEFACRCQAVESEHVC